MSMSSEFMEAAQHGVNRWKPAGSVAVGSGQVLIVDPCNAEQDPDDLVARGLAVVTDTAFGDGLYPVFVSRNELGRPAAMLIVFDSSGCPEVGE